MIEARANEFTIEYGTGIVDASSNDMSLGIVHDKIGSGVMLVIVGDNGATPIIVEPPDVKPEYSIGPNSYSALLLFFFVSMIVS